MLYYFSYMTVSIQTISALLAVILALVGNIPYLRSIIRGQVQPHPYTWMIWSIVSMVTFFGAVQRGAGIGALPTGIAELFTIIIFFYSLRYGWRSIRPIDHIFLGIALLGIIPWIITRDPTISVITVVSIDLVAFISTLRKAYTDPTTEHPGLYMSNVGRHILTLISLRTYNIATTLHSIVMIITNTMMSYFIIRKKSK